MSPGAEDHGSAGLAVARSVSGRGAGGPEEPCDGGSGRGPPAAAGQDRRAADGDRTALREGRPAGGERPFGQAEVDAMRGAQSISTRRAYGVQRVCRVWHCAPLQRVCAAAGAVLGARSAPRADRRRPGRRPGRPHPPGARGLAVSWRGVSESLGEAAGRGGPHREGARAPIDVRTPPPGSRTARATRMARRRTTARSPRRPPT